VANVAPVLAARLIPRWNTPVDFSKTWQGQPLFGSHKTYRGFAAGLLLGALTLRLQWILSSQSQFAATLNILTLDQMNLAVGAWLGFCALLGDLIKSFFKRRWNFAPGRSWFPFDQLDWIIGALFGSCFLIPFKISFWIQTLLVGLTLHLCVKTIGFFMGLNEDWI
jgi:CDP-2,3-bis-(O-geranylgeranyl)-sn-glycerol synthase